MGRTASGGASSNSDRRSSEHGKRERRGGRGRGEVRVVSRREGEGGEGGRGHHDMELNYKFVCLLTEMNIHVPTP